MPTDSLDGRACTVCRAPVTTRVAPWTAQCRACGTWVSNLPPQIDDGRGSAAPTAIDADARATGLEQLRRRNFATVLDRIGALRPLAGARLLDVGSAHGWFLEEAAARGVVATGVEPEGAVTAAAVDRGLDVRVGYFPDVIADGETFDAITFNDVLEHIPDVRATLAACARLLRPGGILSVNIPNAGGLGYRVATRLAGARVRGPYERFWQYGLPSPHQHYFPAAALARLVGESGFHVQRVSSLSAIERRGLWQRVHMTRRATPASALTFAALYAAAPILNRPSQSDIVLVLAERAEASGV